MVLVPAMNEQVSPATLGLAQAATGGGSGSGGGVAGRQPSTPPAGSATQVPVSGWPASLNEQAEPTFMPGPLQAAMNGGTSCGGSQISMFRSGSGVQVPVTVWLSSGNEQGSPGLLLRQAANGGGGGGGLGTHAMTPPANALQVPSMGLPSSMSWHGSPTTLGVAQAATASGGGGGAAGGSQTRTPAGVVAQVPVNSWSSFSTVQV